MFYLSAQQLLEFVHISRYYIFVFRYSYPGWAYFRSRQLYCSQPGYHAVSSGPREPSSPALGTPTTLGHLPDIWLGGVALLWLSRVLRPCQGNGALLHISRSSMSTLLQSLWFLWWVSPDWLKHISVSSLVWSRCLNCFCPPQWTWSALTAAAQKKKLSV